VNSLNHTKIGEEMGFASQQLVAKEENKHVSKAFKKNIQDELMN
jgi:hypothetical protein